MTISQTIASSAKRGCFFAIDCRAWHFVCQLGGINPAIAYLVMACGTGRDNRTTSWSVNAIEKHTPIARSRAKSAISCLETSGAIKRQSGADRPRYYIAAPHEIPDFPGRREALTGLEDLIMWKVKNGTPLDSDDYKHARRAAEKGWLTYVDGKYSIPPAPARDPEWIWLPNELVTGAVGETPPIARIHFSGDVMLLRMFIDLYDAQNLVEDGGVSPRILWQEFSRAEMGRHAEFVIFGFRHAEDWLHWGDLTLPHQREMSKAEKKQGPDTSALDFWRRFQRLIDLGLVGWVPHLFTNETDEAEVIHPYGMGDSDSAEDRLGRLAHQTGLALLTENQRNRAVEHGYRLAPVYSVDFQDAQIMGVARLRYRPKSSMTAAWIAQTANRCEAYFATYERLIASVSEPLVQRA